MLESRPQQLERQERTAVVVLGLCLLGLFAQAIVHYILMGDHAEDHSRDLSIYWRVSPAAPVVLAMVYALLQIGVAYALWLPQRWRRLLICTMLTLLLGCAVGLAQANAFRYFASDAFRFGLSWLALFLTAAAAMQLARLGRTRALVRVVDLLALLAVIDAIATISIFLAFPMFRISTSLYVFAIAWGLVQRRWPRWLGIACVMLGLLAMFLSGKRGMIVAVAAFSPILFWYHVHHLRLLVKNLAITVPACLLLAALLQSYSYRIPLGREFLDRGEQLVFNAYEIVMQDRFDASLKYRFNELKNIAIHFRQHPEDIFLGAGFGAEIRMHYDSSVSSLSGAMHQVHSGWAAYLIRNGLLGVCLLIALCSFAIRPLLSCARGPYGPPVMICSTYIGVQLILSLKSQLMLEELALPIVIGLVAGLHYATLAERRDQFLHTVRGNRRLRREPPVVVAPEAVLSGPAPTTSDV